MLYRRPRRRRVYLYSSFYRKPRSRFQRLMLNLLAFLLLIGGGLSLILWQLRPLLFKEAKTAVTDIVQTEINDVIQQEILNGLFDYSQLVSIKEVGNTTVLMTNSQLINMLQTRITSGVCKAVTNEVISNLKIPLGNAIGGTLLSGRGPNFNVRILSVADVDTKLTSSIEAAGINQTWHKIYLTIWADIDMMIPGYKADTITVMTEVMIANTVLVGPVPNVYTNVGAS